MALYIVTGNYTPQAFKGMLANPSDREAEVKPIVEEVGGRVVSYLFTTGDSDFSMVVETDDVEGMLSALMVAGASGTVSNLKTVQAFTSAQFVDAQKRAGSVAAKYKAAG